MYPPPPGPGYQQGYQPQSYPPPPRRLRAVRGLAIFAIAALVCDSALGVIVAGIDLWYAGLVDRMIVDLDSVPESEINTADLVYGLSGIPPLVVYVLAAVAFVIWMFRVRENAEILSPGGHRHARAWVIFGWVVPIISLWFPKQIMDDIWYASAYATHPGRIPRGLLNAWWAAFLLDNLVSNVAARLIFNAEELESLASAARFDAVSTMLSLVAAVLAILVVRKVTDAQEAQRQAQAPMPGSAYGGYPAY